MWVHWDLLRHLAKGKMASCCSGLKINRIKDPRTRQTLVARGGRTRQAINLALVRLVANEEVTGADAAQAGPA